MSSKASLLVDAVNNNSIRADRGVRGYLLAYVQSRKVLIDGTSEIDVSVFDNCKVCVSTYQALYRAQVQLYRVSVRLVEKGVYVLGACGTTHFVANRKFVRDGHLSNVNVQGYDTTVRSGVDIGAARGATFGGGLAASSEKQPLDGVGAGAFGSIDPGIGLDRFRAQGAISQAMATGYSTDTSYDTSAGSVYSVGDTRVSPTLSTRLNGAEKRGWQNLRAATDKGVVVKRFFAALQRGVSVAKVKTSKSVAGQGGYKRVERDARETIKWSPVGDVWCRKCANDDERCPACQVLVDAQLYEAMLRCANAKKQLEASQKAEGETIPFRAEENRFEKENDAEENKRNFKNLTIDTSGLSGATANMKKKKNQPVVGSRPYEQYALFNKCHELAASLPTNLKLRLLSSEDLAHAMVHDEDKAVNAFSKMRRTTQMEAASRLSKQDLLTLANEK